MNTHKNDLISRNFHGLARMLDAKPINLPRTWLAAWSDFGAWLLSNADFGADKFATSQHHALVAEIVNLASQHHSDANQWSVPLAKSRQALTSALKDADLDDECVAAVSATYAFVMAAFTGNRHWAELACQAAATARAHGWAAYAKSFSASKIYAKTLDETLAAQMAKLELLVNSYQALEHKCAA